MGLTGYAVVAAVVIVGIALLRHRILAAQATRRDNAARNGSDGWIPASTVSPDRKDTPEASKSDGGDGDGSAGD